MPGVKICVVQCASLCSAAIYASYMGVNKTLFLNDYPHFFPYEQITGDNAIFSRFLRESSGLEGFDNYIKNFSEKYINTLKKFVVECMRHASSQECDLIIFPEYSITADLLPDIQAAATKYQLTVVAGAHTVGAKSLTQHPYREQIESLAPKQWKLITVCPVCTPEGEAPEFILKQVTSRYETGVTSDFAVPSRRPITAPFRNRSRYAGQENFTLAVVICAEYVVSPNRDDAERFRIAEQIEGPAENADVVAIIGWSPQYLPFHNSAVTFLNEHRHGGRIAIAFCNTALYGGSFILSRGDNADDGAFQPLTDNFEALLYRVVPVGGGAGARNAPPASPPTLYTLVVESQLQKKLLAIATAFNDGSVLDPANGLPTEVPKSLESLLHAIKYVVEDSGQKRGDSIALKRYIVLKKDHSCIYSLYELYRDLLRYFGQILIDGVPQLNPSDIISLLHKRILLLQKIGISDDSLSPPGEGGSAAAKADASKPSDGSGGPRVEDFIVPDRPDEGYDFCLRITSLPNEDSGIAYQTRLTGQVMDLLAGSSQIDTIELRYVTPDISVSEAKVNIFFLFRFVDGLDHPAKEALAKEIFAIWDDRLLTYRLQMTRLDDGYFKDFGGNDLAERHVRYIGRKQSDDGETRYAMLGRGEASSIVKLLAYLRSHSRVSIVLRKPKPGPRRVSRLNWEENEASTGPGLQRNGVLSVVSTEIHDLQDLQDAHHSLTFQPEMYFPNTDAGRTELFPVIIAFYSTKDHIEASVGTIAYELAGPGRYEITEDDPEISLSEREVYHILKLPFGSSIPGFRHIRDDWSLSASDLPPQKSGIILGDVDVDRRGRTPFCWRNSNRDKHLYVIGQTGTGKSYFLSSLIARDIDAGRGLMVLDPHGDLISSVLARIPPERQQDVLLFDPNDRIAPPALNMLEADLADDFSRSTIIDEAVSIFLTLYGPEIFGPRIQQYFRGAVLSLMDYREAQGTQTTLEDVGRIFLDENFRNVVRKVTVDPVARLFWNEYDATDRREQREIIPYFQAKFGPFLSNIRLRKIISQPHSSMDLRREMDRRSIVLVDLSKGRIGDVMSRLLGMILVSKLNWAAQSRIELPQEQRQSFGLYVDECQNFASPTFSTMLSEARKYGLSLVLSNQYLGQLRLFPDYTRVDPNHLVNAVLGNVGTLISFRTGHEDAKIMAREMVGEVLGEEAKLAKAIASNSNFQAMLSIVDGGKRLSPVRLFSRQWDRLEDASSANIVRKISQEKILAMSKTLKVQAVSSDSEDAPSPGQKPVFRHDSGGHQEDEPSIDVEDYFSKFAVEQLMGGIEGDEMSTIAEERDVAPCPFNLPRIAWSTPLDGVSETEALDKMGISGNSSFVGNDIGSILDGLANSMSLSIGEKRRVIDAFPELSGFQISGLRKVFTEEHEKFTELIDSNQNQVINICVTAWVGWACLTSDFFKTSLETALEKTVQSATEIVTGGCRSTVLETLFTTIQSRSEVGKKCLKEIRKMIDAAMSHDVV